MSDNTTIEWATHTWNPWEGCTKVSPGCTNCYAEARNRRFSKGANWGKGKPRRRTSAATWRKPVIWNRDAEKQKRNDIGPFREMRPRVFPSLCDWLDDEVLIEWLDDFLRLIHDTPNLDWLLLTKRPENWLSRLRRVYAREEMMGGDGMAWAIALNHWLHGKPPANVWIGTSVEDQLRADERIPELLKIPAVVRFLSVEPLLGPVELPFLGIAPKDLTNGSFLPISYLIDWVIIGGESGPGARPCNIEWIRDIVRQCKAASVPCFVKQLGSRVDIEDCEAPIPFRNTVSGKDGRWYVDLKHPKGGDPAEWPEDLRVRQFPTFATK
jgi:protein gp37